MKRSGPIQRPYAGSKRNCGFGKAWRIEKGHTDDSRKSFLMPTGTSSIMRSSRKLVTKRR